MQQALGVLVPKPRGKFCFHTSQRRPLHSDAESQQRWHYLNAEQVRPSLFCAMPHPHIYIYIHLQYSYTYQNKFTTQKVNENIYNTHTPLLRKHCAKACVPKRVKTCQQNVPNRAEVCRRKFKNVPRSLVGVKQKPAETCSARVQARRN